MLRPSSRAVYAEAINLFERALTLDPQWSEAQSRLAHSLIDRVQNQMTDSAAVDLARADALISEALAASPRSAYAHLVMGRVLQAQTRWEEAVLEFETALALDRNFAGALHHLASAKLITGSIEEVIPLEIQAIQLGPRNPGIAWHYSTIATVHLLQSRTDEAVVWLEKVRSAIPAAPGPRSRLAAAYALKGEIDRAASELAEVRKLAGGGRYSSLAHMKAAGYAGSNTWGVPRIRALFEATYFAGLRLAGMPEE
jgi:tetratricopeptide (TPR) repeat protein